MLRGLITGLVLLGNLILLAALSFHVIVAPGKIALVAKDHLTMIDTYRDLREWSPADVASHPAILSRLTDAGRLDLISHVPAATPTAVRTQTSSSSDNVSMPVLNPAATLVTQVQSGVKSSQPTVVNNGVNTSGNTPMKPVLNPAQPTNPVNPTTKPANGSGGKTSIFDFGQ